MEARCFVWWPWSIGLTWQNPLSRWLKDPVCFFQLSSKLMINHSLFFITWQKKSSQHSSTWCLIHPNVICNHQERSYLGISLNGSCTCPCTTTSNTSLKKNWTSTRPFMHRNSPGWSSLMCWRRKRRSRRRSCRWVFLWTNHSSFHDFQTYWIDCLFILAPLLDLLVRQGFQRLQIPRQWQYTAWYPHLPHETNPSGECQTSRCWGTPQELTKIAQVCSFRWDWCHVLCRKDFVFFLESWCWNSSLIPCWI